MFKARVWRKTKIKISSSQLAGHQVKVVTFKIIARNFEKYPYSLSCPELDEKINATFMS